YPEWLHDEVPWPQIGQKWVIDAVPGQAAKVWVCTENQPGVEFCCDDGRQWKFPSKEGWELAYRGGRVKPFGTFGPAPVKSETGTIRYPVPGEAWFLNRENPDEAWVCCQPTGQWYEFKRNDDEWNIGVSAWEASYRAGLVKRCEEVI